MWEGEAAAAAHLEFGEAVDADGDDGHAELLCEQADLRAARPEVFERLRAEYARWEAQMLKRPARDGA